MRTKAIVGLFAFVLAQGGIRVGSAGVLDDAPPDEDGKQTIVVYRMGAIHHEAGYADFTITCTNIGRKKMRVGLEVYDENDRQTGNLARISLDPGASGTFASTTGLPAAGTVIVVDLPPIEHGKARVSAKKGEIVCTALSHLHGDGGEMRQLPLTLLKRVAVTHEGNDQNGAEGSPNAN